MAKAPTRADAPMDMRQVLQQIDWAIAERDPNSLVLVGVGGFGASGKTTFANVVAHAHPRCQIVATDSFYNGESFELDRLLLDVVEVVESRRRASFCPWDWDAGCPGSERIVKPSGLLVIEGVCALHHMFRDHYDLRIWIDTPADVRLARAVERDGESARDRWLSVWMPSEAAYAERDEPVLCADAVIDGTAILG